MVKQIFVKFKKIRHKEIWIDSMIGMTLGFIATLVIGTIIGLLSINQDNDFSHLVINIKNALFYITPFAIGIGCAYKNNLKNIEIFSVAIASFIMSQSTFIPSFLVDDNSINWTGKIGIFSNINIPHSGDVFGAWISSIISIYILKIFNIQNSIKIILLPLFFIFIGIVESLSLVYLTSTLTVIVEWVLEKTINKHHWLGILFAPIIGMIMGLALSLPTSSAAIAFAINMHGDVATSSIAGTSAQMISFGVLTYISTGKISKAVSVGLGTSMLQIKNFAKKPIILLFPTLMSGLTAIIATSSLPLDYPPRSVTPGMGTCSFYGQIFTLEENGWTNLNAYLNIFLIQLLLPLLITFASSNIIFKRIKKEWLVI